MTELAVDFRPQVTHSHNFSLLADCHVEAGLGPLIVSAFGSLNPLIGSKRPLNPRIDSLMAKGPTIVVENPLLFNAVAKRHGGVDCEHICLGVNAAHFKPGKAAQRAAWRQALQIPDDTVLFFSARGIADSYRQDDILKAFAMALPDLPQTAGLAMIRLTRSLERSDMIESLQRQADELGVSDRLFWIPEVRYEMMPGMYAMVDHVVSYPSEDAFPSTLLEAAACGVPIVTANLPAYAGSYIEQFCMLVDPDDRQALARALVRAVLEPEEFRT
ncbi:MAG: glycosyltransferase, partial [Pseudomonadota bacterium]